MSFAIDLASNGQALKKAYNQVLSSDPETTWAIFGYEAGNSLNVQETGDNLQEFCDTFDDSQVQYGIVQVDFNQVNKVALVGWVGEGTPSSKRTAFNAHFSAVARYFPGYHVQLAAAEGDELTPSVIIGKVSSGAGAKYSLTQGKSAPSTKPKYRQADSGANEDDWGDSAPVQVKETSELTKVPTAYTKAKVEVVRQPVKFEQEKPAEKKPIDLKALREQDKYNKFANTKPEKSEPSYKPVGKVDLKAIHESARKQAEASGKQVEEQYSSLKDRMSAFKLGVESSKPQYDTNTRSVPRAKPAATKTTSSETSPWASKGNSAPKAAPRAVPKASPAPAPRAPARSPSPDSEPEEATTVSGARAAFLNAGKEQPAKKDAPAPKAENAEKASFADLTSKFAKKDEPKEDPYVPNPVPKAKEPAPAPAPAPARAPAPASAPERSPEPEAQNGSLSATVITAYTAEDDDDEISLEVGELVTDIDKLDDFWWLGTNSKGAAGLFPKENVQVKATPSKAPEPTKTSAPAPAPAARGVPLPPKREEPKKEAAAPAPAPAQPSRSLPPPPPARASASPSPAPPARAPAPAAAPAASTTVYVVTAYDADPDADDEISLVVGEAITDVDRLDENWWAGVNSKGEHGLFPVENVSDKKPSGSSAPAPAPPARAPAATPAAASTVGEAAGVSAIAHTTYEADEDDELGFKAGDKIVNIEFPSADWWSGEIDGRVGLFPPDFVDLQ